MPAQCIEWTKCKDTSGYGQVKRNGRMRMAHRCAWEDSFGPIPVGLSVLHKCDNRGCVNVDHLFLGTQKQNIQDAISKGRFKFPVTPKGEDAPWSKLSQLDVQFMRDNKGIITQSRLAEKFGVSQPCVSRIQRNERWVACAR